MRQIAVEGATEALRQNRAFRRHRNSPSTGVQVAEHVGDGQPALKGFDIDAAALFRGESMV
jgi:hypothetical protein